MLAGRRRLPGGGYALRYAFRGFAPDYFPDSFRAMLALYKSRYFWSSSRYSLKPYASSLSTYLSQSNPILVCLPVAFDAAVVQDGRILAAVVDDAG